MKRIEWSTIFDWWRWAIVGTMATNTFAMLAPAQLSKAASAPQLTASVPSTAHDPSGFVPNGWVLEQQQQSDFNGDGREDALLLIRKVGTAGIPPRMLMVALRQNDGYALAEMNSRLIPHSEETNYEDPMTDGELIAGPGSFSLKLTLISGAGSYEMETLHYRFRYQEGCFRLAGYDRMKTNRATLDTHDLIVDFLTGAVIERSGNAQSSNSDETRFKLKTNPLLCFGDLNNATDFHPN